MSKLKRSFGKMNFFFFRLVLGVFCTTDAEADAEADADAEAEAESVRTDRGVVGDCDSDGDCGEGEMDGSCWVVDEGAESSGDLK